MKTELRTIPYVGKATEASLLSLGYTTIASLRGQDPEDIYARDCLRRGCPIDRCQLSRARAITSAFTNGQGPFPAAAHSRAR